jgi:TM2 domain-containing membrane protein YozV
MMEPGRDMFGRALLSAGDEAMLSEDDVRRLRAEIQADTAAGRYEAVQAKVRLLTAAGQELYAPPAEPSTIDSQLVGAGGPGAGAAREVQPARKNPVLAAFLSFVVCGLGQIYNGELLRGIVLFVLFAVLLVVFWALEGNFTIGLLVPIVLWIFGIVDAYRAATQMNRETATPAGGR